MLVIDRHTQQLAGAQDMRRVRSLAPWRFWTVLVTIIAFVSLLATASTHNHASAADDGDCPVCSIVTHKTVDLPKIDLPKQVLVFISYVAFQAQEICSIHVSPALLPPSCGPPAGV